MTGNLGAVFINWIDRLGGRVPLSLMLAGKDTGWVLLLVWSLDYLEEISECDDIRCQVDPGWGCCRQTHSQRNTESED